MDPSFIILKQPAPGARIPVLVSVPHYGTEPLPHVGPEDYREPRFQTFPYGFADTFAADLYADLHEHGATVLATPVSRMFVDVNRRRDDFECRDGEVRSRRGVVRTHTMRDVPIFARPLTPAEVEARLCAVWDPYYGALESLLGRLRETFGHAVLLDGHTGSPRRMGDHQVIIGTCRGTTCAPALAAAAAGVFARHGFRAHLDVAGYTGGNIVATYGRPATRGVHALQIEVNAALLAATDGEDLVACIIRGERPRRADAALARLHACLRELVAVLPGVLRAAVPGEPAAPERIERA